jgi:hypothetical protein
VSRLGQRFALLFALLGIAGCSPDPGTAALRQPVIYDADDRGEYYDAVEPLTQVRLARSSVAFVPREYIDSAESRLRADVPTWGSTDNICPDEPFANQPAVAFCSGVLVDWDLVLTAGHCVRVLDIADFYLVFEYFNIEPNRLAMAHGAVARSVEILAEALDPEGSEPRLDYAWLRLAEAVSSRFEPVPFFQKGRTLVEGERLITIGSPHGVPLKFDAEGRVEQVRDQEDFFIARTDTSAGWSGGAAYDGEHVLIGILARGGIDLVPTLDGCQTTLRLESTEAATEQFTYAYRAFEALCTKQPQRAICRGCGRVCQAAEPPDLALRPRGGCAFTSSPQPTSDRVLPLFLFGIWAARQRKRSRAARRPVAQGTTTAPRTRLCSS